MNKFNTLFNEIINEMTEVNHRWSSEGLAECMSKIIEKLEAAGFIIDTVNAGSDLGNRRIRFCIPGDHKVWKIGTYTNCFSFKEMDINYTEAKWICFKEVYKHNGAAANASIDCYVLYNGQKQLPTWHPHFVKSKNITLQMPESHTDYKQINIKRFKANISDKLIDKMLTEAINAYNTLELKDWTGAEAIPPEN